jgi:hypothetical protein
VTEDCIVSSGDGPRRAGEGAVAVAVAVRVISCWASLLLLPHSPSSLSLLRLLLVLLHSHPSSSSASRTRANAVVHADSADDDGGGAAAASRAAARNEGRLPTTLIGLGATSRLPSMISNSSKIAPWFWRSQASAGQPKKAVSIARSPSVAAQRTRPRATVHSDCLLPMASFFLSYSTSTPMGPVHGARPALIWNISPGAVAATASDP